MRKPKIPDAKRKLKAWGARRAGAGITITGVDVDTNAAVRVTGIDRIEAGRPGAAAIAFAKNGDRYELLL
jgi:hypothetical protein